MKVIFDVESIAIVNDDGSNEHLFWHKDEWIEDPEVVFSIVNAIKLTYTNPIELLNIINK